jgi:glutamyl-tRNA reductase
VASQLAKMELNKVTILGAGDTGELMIRYLQKLNSKIHINLVNRDSTKLHLVASKHEVNPFPISMLKEAITESDAVVVTTNASAPLVDASHVTSGKLKVIYDLSVPRNVDASLYELMNVLDVDAISKHVNETIANRLQEVPRVESIITAHIDEFKNWSHRRQLYSIH